MKDLLLVVVVGIIIVGLFALYRNTKIIDDQ